MASLVASNLGEEVLKDSAAIVKPYFAESLQSMSLNSDDYAVIVALSCIEMPKGKEMDDTPREKLKDTCTINIMKPDNPEDVQPSTNVSKENQEGIGSHKLAGSTGHHFLVLKKIILIALELMVIGVSPIKMRS